MIKEEKIKIIKNDLPNKNSLLSKIVEEDDFDNDKIKKVFEKV